VNLNDYNLKLDVLTILSQTQGVVQLGNFLSLPRLPTRKKLGKEPLGDYSNSHVVTLDQYSAMLRQKALEEKKMLIKSRSIKEKKERRKYQDELNTHLHKIQD
jgi:hypothetical protein